MEMQEGSFGKIDQAVSQNVGWLKDKLTTAVDNVNYANAGDWLTANRDLVEQQLSLSRAETGGQNWQRLRQLMHDVLMGTFVPTVVTENKPKIKFGDEIETGEKTEILTLQAKIDLLKPLLSYHSSGGAACVPTSYAYMQILGERIRDPREQQGHLNSILNRWKREFNSKWIKASELVDDSQAKETVPSLNHDNILFKIAGLDTLIQFLITPEGKIVYPKAGKDLSPVQVGKPENRLGVISTVGSLTGKVVSVEPTNPFWRQPGVDDPPRVGEYFTSAGDHAMLVIDHKLPENQDPRQMLLTLVDPQTGTVFQLTAEEIYLNNLSNFHEHYGYGTQADQNIGVLRASVACGACWVDQLAG